ncbi:GTPase [Fervidicoccus fontis]|uniref:GTP-binding protein, HSR1-related protein n=2 Tax=Fervidicoccus fontis TaxID=683846 RepID=I0A2J0_FERFK|nr:GTPase [Fervidicoccus fontis]AFH43197.1 GTP-binding protein, HSR1-related protein [Fervidicoccus fontis Kam940]
MKDSMKFLRKEKMLEMIRESDFVLETVDARNSLGTRSIKLEKLAFQLNKQFAILLNKIDIVPAEVVAECIKYFKDKGIIVIPISAEKNIGRGEVVNFLLEIKEKLGKEKIVGMIAGVPKTGKSSVINMLKKKDSANISPLPGKPGYTKSTSIYKISSGIYIYDTPGVFPDARDYIEKTIRSSPPEKLKDPVSIAVELIQKASNISKNALSKIYKIEWSGDPYSFLEALAKKRGWIERKSKEPIIDEAARTIIIDYLKGKLKIYKKCMQNS